MKRQKDNCKDEDTVPCKMIVNQGIVTRIIPFLDSSYPLCFQFNAVWVMNNTLSSRQSFCVDCSYV